MRSAGGAAHGSRAERIYSRLLRVYPPVFRTEYGMELSRTFSELHRGRKKGVIGVAAFWAAVLLDLMRSAPGQWAAELREQASRRRPSLEDHRPPYRLAALAGLAVFTLYALTLAPTIGLWDAGEYTAVAHTLGIPHPPGSPLFVMVAHAWELLLSPTGLPPAVRINLFSAFLSAAAHALWFLVVERVLWSKSGEPRSGDRWLRWGAAATAVAFSATAFTVWNQSNVTEKVYAIPFFTTALVSWLALRWRDTGRDPGRLAVIVLIVALNATNHLMGVLVVPALVAFVLLVDRRALLRPRLWRMALPLVVLSLSVQFFLPIRAGQRPIISQGQPECASFVEAASSVYTWGGSGCEALSAVLSRAQYGKPSVLLNPTVYPLQEVPRDAALFASQLTNYAQYFDWQWGRSVAGADPLFGGVRPLITLFVFLLGLYGGWAHWKRDRQSAAYLGMLFLTLSVGLVVYMNFRYGYSIARDRFPEATMHEARERDYFFVIGFSVWGLWMGIGLATLWSRVAESLRGTVRRPALVAAPLFAFAVLPLVLNWSWASRADDFTARDFAYNLLMSVEPYGVLVTNGDNDTFPLWYVQEVEGIRRDVTVMVSEYLSTPWYVKQMRQLTEPCPDGVSPADTPTRIVCQRPLEAERLPHPLVQAGWARGAQLPRDTIFPLSDEEIDQIVASYFVTPEPLLLRAGALETTIEPGTPVLPADMFVAAMLRATLGERPIHFMPGSRIVTTLGLWEHTVRQGMTWKIRNGSGPEREEQGVVRFPRNEFAAFAGAAIDLPITDTLAWEVYIRRGRITDPDAPWVDAAAGSIPVQYAYTHYAAAQGHLLGGDEAEAGRHLREAERWEQVLGD